MFNKIKLAAAGGAVALGMIAIPAFASVSINNVLFDNGTGNVTTSAGSSINVHLYVNTSGTNDVESVFVTFPGAGGQAQNGVCYNVTDQVGESPVNGWVINFNVKAPMNAGVWPIVFGIHGTNGDDADQGCFTTPDSQATFNGRVTVEASNSSGNPTGNSGGSSTVGGATSDTFATILSSLQAILAKLTAPTPAPTPTPTGNAAKCDLARPYLGAQPYAYSSVGVQLQSVLLLDDPNSIPLLAAGSTVKQGYFGTQTHQALTNYSSKYSCQFIFN